MTSSSRSAPRRPRASGGRKSALRRLADLAGIIPDYVDQTGIERRVTSDATRIAILRAMGIDASTEERAATALRAWQRVARAEVLAPVRVVGIDDPSLDRPPVRRLRGAYRWRVELVLEDGRRLTAEGGNAAAISLPVRPPLGYHTLRLTVQRARGERVFEQSLIVVPPRCTLPGELLGPRRAFGVIANLYTVRSARNWGVGDLTDLAMLARWAGTIGADFVGVNPLHALLDRAAHVSPYSPVSRLFRNVVYVAVENVPELVLAPHVADRLDNPAFQAELGELREIERVHYDQIAFLKRAALVELHRAFVERGEQTRRRAYHDWCAVREPELTRFATWMAIGEARVSENENRRSGTGDGGPGARRPEESIPGVGADSADAFDWRLWPEELRDPRSDAVRRFVEEHAAEVDFHRWLQFETDRQLGEAARAARESGLGIGLYQDLAIGTSGAGSDAWSFPGLFVDGASVGAPPDSYAATGQDWGLPPLDPRALRADRYRYFSMVVRSGLRHAGALRIDHVMGLFRLFWIPEGLSGKDGAYVRYPASDLLGILALESVRSAAIVVGEDLGTVPPDVPPALAKWGILSSTVMYFERGKRGEFRPAASYPVLALATANTHDMATLTGFWQGSDVELRREVGLVDAGDALRRERENRAADRRALLRRLEAEGVLPSGWARQADGIGAMTPGRSSGGDDEIVLAELRGAVHEFLCRSPAVLVGLALDDLTGEVEAVNVPGVGPDRYPSWTRRMRTSLEELRVSAAVAAALRTGGRGRPR